MNLITIDQKKCVRDGICVATCPTQVFELKDGLPIPIEGRRCTRCGQCVAGCPQGAISLAGMKPEDCPPFKKEMIPDEKQVEYWLRSRRSVRAYKDKALDPEIIHHLIEIARYAPTGGNFQQIKWSVVNSKEGVREIAGAVVDLLRYLIQEKNGPFVERFKFFVHEWDSGNDLVCFGAPALVFTLAPEESLAYRLSVYDCSIALSFLDIAAPSFGLGTCWSGFLINSIPQWEPLQKMLDIPEGYRCFGAMMLGYPKYKYYRHPLRKDPDITWLW